MPAPMGWLVLCLLAARPSDAGGPPRPRPVPRVILGSAARQAVRPGLRLVANPEHPKAAPAPGATLLPGIRF